MPVVRKFICLLSLIISFSACTVKLTDKFTYLAQDQPTTTPKIFAKDLISKSDQSEFGSVFSKDGKEFFYGVDINGRTEIRFVQSEKGEWTESRTILSHEKYGYNDPFLSPDENELYYISNQPMNGKGEPKDIDIWYSKRTKQGWSEPINAGPNINSDKEEYYISFTNKGTMYFSTNVNAEEKRQGDFDIYTSERINGQYQLKQKLGPAINTNAYEADVFIAPDESYMIFCANRQNVGLGRGDLYISFKDANGDWTPSKNMGAPINSKNHELCPFVTADGKYLFYTSNQDIYWVSTEIFQSIKNK